jgi:hypothetical protein
MVLLLLPGVVDGFAVNVEVLVLAGPAVNCTLLVKETLGFASAVIVSV